MITLYLVRHGETTYNAQGRIQGHLDSPLSDLGLRQAEAVAARLARESFAAVYASDLSRASVTARAIAGPHQLPVNETQLLRESRLGVVEGLTSAEMEERYPAVLHEWRRSPLLFRPPGAETLEEVVERVGGFLEQALRNHRDGEKILVVGHGGSLRGLVIAALGLPIKAYRMLHFSNASLSMLDAGERPGLWLLNETSHLNALRTSEEEVDNIAH